MLNILKKFVKFDNKRGSLNRTSILNQLTADNVEKGRKTIMCKNEIC